MRKLQESITESMVNENKINDYDHVSEFFAMEPQSIDLNSRMIYLMYRIPWRTDKGSVSVFNVDNLKKFCQSYCSSPVFNNEIELDEVIDALNIKVGETANLDEDQFWIRIK